MTRSAVNTKVKAGEVSALCRSCTKMKECLNTRHIAFLMAYTTYCSRFDNKDKTPRMFPFYQPYEQEWRDAEYIYRKAKGLKV